MTRRHKNRKRALCFAGLFFPCTIASGSSFRQHIVKPARRIVSYSVGNRKLPSHVEKIYGQREVSDGNVKDEVEKLGYHPHKRQMVNHDSVGERVIHILADASIEEDHVDKVFAELRRQYTPSSSYLDDQEYFDSVHMLRSSSLRSEEEQEPKTTATDRLSSWFRSLNILNSPPTSNITANNTASFVEDSEKVPIELDETPVDGKQGNSSETTRVIGFNITTDTEYNVSATVVFDKTDEEGNSISNSTTTELDTSTVVYTKAEPQNDTLTVENNTQDFMDELTDVPNPDAFSEGIGNADTNSTSVLDKKVFRPIRMRAFLSEISGGGQYLKPNEQFTLMQQMIRPALLAWSAALRVDPVQGNLTVDATQLHDGKSCGPGSNGLPSVVVPLQHIEQGVPDTDLILYISLSFTDNETTPVDEIIGSNGTDLNVESSGAFSQARTNETMMRDSNFTQAPRLSLKDRIRGFDQALNESKLENSTSAPTTEPKPRCMGDYVAASAFCSTDQYDRPTAALLHVCIDDTFFNPANLATNIHVMMHELGHALGFNSVSLAHFRNYDGTPMTERTETGEVPLQEIDCTGPVTQARHRSLIPLPSPNILQFRTVRNGVRVAEIVTPSVAQTVRNHFDCEELPGAELESGEFLPLSSNPDQVSCLGDHWERRLFQSDLMNPLVEPETVFNPRFSTLTLAYFADSGWYQADLSRANYPSIWGRGAGCDFVEQPCVSEDGNVSPSYESFFCTQKPGTDDDDGFSSEIQGCTPDLSRKASCSLDKYEGELPPEYQYFRNNYGADFGGNDPFMDYCPVYSGFSNGLCSDSENEAVIRINRLERFGRRNSRCLSSKIQYNPSIQDTQSTTKPNQLVEMHQTGLCMPIACVVEDRSLRIQVDGKWRTCIEEDQILIATMDNDVVSILCPDPIRICPTFYCQRDCLGRSDRRTKCDYSIGDCVCEGSNETKLPLNRACPLVDNSHGDSSSGDGSGHHHGGGTVPPSRLFYNPNQSGGSSELPDPDSPLADYYVPTARNLREEDGSVALEKWIIISSSVAGALVFVAVSFLSWKRRQNSRTGEGSDEDDQGGEGTINPDKHKMVAAVVVNMRMNDPSLQRRVREDALNNRLSETDMSMTDSEATRGDTHESEEFVASEEASTVDRENEDYEETGRMNLDDDEMNDTFGLDPLAPPSQQQPVVRRRHIPMLGRGGN